MNLSKCQAFTALSKSFMSTWVTHFIFITLSSSTTLHQRSKGENRIPFKSLKLRCISLAVAAAWLSVTFQ